MEICGRRSTVFVCEPGWEALLRSELAAEFASSVGTILQPGWAAVDEAAARPLPDPAVALSRQCLPEAELVEAASIAAWGRLVATWLIDRLADAGEPWRLQVFSNPIPGGTAGPRRAALVAEAVQDELRRRRRSLLRQLLADSHEPPIASEFRWAPLVQVGLLSAERGLLSLADREQLVRFRHVVSGFPGGIVAVPPDKSAPSRAFAKLVEALLHFGQDMSPSQTCVDLGASPGGWTYIAVQRGCQVTAVDRSPLRDDLMRHRQVEFVRGDAFKYRPPAPVDWLVSDVVAFPERIQELLADWLGAGRCRRFVVTIKFRGAADVEVLQRVKRLLRTHCRQWGLRRLGANKNEVTALGEVRTAADPSL